MIGEAKVNIKQLIEDSCHIHKPLTLNKKFYDDMLKQSIGKTKNKMVFESDNNEKFWVDLYQRNSQTGAAEQQGKVMIQVDVVPMDIAKKNPVGRAR